MSEQTELEILFPQEYTVTIKEKNESVAIKPFKFRKIFKVIEIITKIAERMTSAGKNEEALFELLTQSEDKVVEILSLALDKPANWFDDLEGETGVEILTAVWKVNKSFFDSKLAPLLKEMGFGRQEESSTSLPEKNEILTDEEVNRLLNMGVEEELQIDTNGQTQ